MNTLSSLLEFIGGLIAPFATDQTANKVLASPNGSAGKPLFRSLVAADMPTIPINKGGSGQTAVTSPTASISTSSGTLVSSGVRQWGKVVMVSLNVKNSQNVDSGDIVWSGTLNTATLRPALGARGCSQYGSRVMVGWINADGTMGVRTCGGSALPANTGVNCELTFIIP